MGSGRTLSERNVARAASQPLSNDKAAATVADLSHRLRTPVTALRLDAGSVADPELAVRLRDHISHLERTVDAIVKDARRPVRSPLKRSCDAAHVVRDRVASWSALESTRAVTSGCPSRRVRFPSPSMRASSWTWSMPW